MYYDPCTKGRPENYRINSGHPLYNGMAFGNFGGNPRTLRYQDDSSGQNNGTLTGYSTDPTNANSPGNQWQWDNYLRRWVLGFDGSADYVSATLVPATSYTKVAWVNLSANGNYPAVMCFGSSENEDLRFYGTTRVAQLNNVSGDAVTVGTWSHLAGVCIGTTGTLYQNGVSKGSGGVSVLGGSLLIGKRSDGAFLPGNIADPLFYNRALSPSEIARLADPSNVMLSGLLLPPRRRLFAASVTGVGYRSFWAPPRQRIYGASL